METQRSTSAQRRLSRRSLYRMLSLIAFGCCLGWEVTADRAVAAEELTPADREFFEKQVRPLLVQHCYRCHSAQKPQGGLVLETRSGVRKGGDSGPVITPGKPDASLLIEAVRYTNRDLQMPPNSRLAPTEVAILEKWVTLGTPDPREDRPEVAGPLVGMSIEEGRQFWSFQPVGNPPVPSFPESTWVQTPIDAFILRDLERSELRPAPSADKRTLLRRVSYDLTGLPPTPDEVQAFLADESPDAFAKVVERLLASKHYGVRWGRHWLDVARYADSNGLDENLAYGNAWRYRDYVVDAFNNDKPYDQFVIEQLAGDLVPRATEETKIATGFLSLGAKVLAEPDREKLDMDTIDEQLDTLGKAFLGMTFGCVRCHDHKFDPVKMPDYYGLAAILKSTRTYSDASFGAIRYWHEFSFANPSELEALKPIDAEIAEKKSAASKFRSEAINKLRTTARSKAAVYLAAAAQFSVDARLADIEPLARSLDLHPHILHHCRRHLANRPEDPVFARWHELAAVGDAAGIEAHYAALFAEVEAAIAEQQKSAPNQPVLGDPRLEAARLALNEQAGMLAIPTIPRFAFDAATLAEFDRLSEIARVVESQAPDAAAAMGVVDGPVVAAIPIHLRGNHRTLGPMTPRSFPAVMRDGQTVPIFPTNHSGRLELAQWLASSQHPLTARVYVNRIWRWHFGRGIVASTENFGKLGDRPSHPELLDWLTRRFIESGWSTKELHRLILSSSVYQMDSVSPIESQAQRVDADNKYLWQFPRRRLEAEELRDAVLMVSGRLNDRLGGKVVPLRNRQFVFDHTSLDYTKYDSVRRALYLPVIRNAIYSLFEQFDFPDPTMPTGSRNTTVVAPQALVLMNSDLVLDSAESWARSLLAEKSSDRERVQTAYQWAFARPPSEAEVDRGLAFIQRSTDSVSGWSLFCQSLLASNEFLYLR